MPARTASEASLKLCPTMGMVPVRNCPVRSAVRSSCAAEMRWNPNSAASSFPVRESPFCSSIPAALHRFPRQLCSVIQQAMLIARKHSRMGGTKAVRACASRQSNVRKKPLAAAPALVTAHDQNTGIDRKKTGEKAVPAFDLRAQLPGNFKQWFPQKDPAPTGADKITPAVITFLPKKQTDYGRQEQKQQQCGITADAFPQCLEQRRSAKTLQNAPRVFCYLQSIHRLWSR